MTVFAEYSTYYDIFNVSKEYVAEVEFVLAQLDGTSPAGQTMLDLGCGTGLHAAAFEERGWQVLGVDMSPTMLEMAQARRLQLPADRQQKLDFTLGDARTFRSDRQFDLVTSLFHVASYQADNGDLDRF